MASESRAEDVFGILDPERLVLEQHVSLEHAPVETEPAQIELVTGTAVGDDPVA